MNFKSNGKSRLKMKARLNYRFVIVPSAFFTLTHLVLWMFPVLSSRADNWIVQSPPLQNFQAICSSADGNMLAEAPWGGYPGTDSHIYTSTNAGGTWTQSGSASGNWIGICSSADGSKLAANTGGFFYFQNPGYIYTSTNAGLTWIQTAAPLWQWSGIASSADGTTLAAVAVGGSVCISTDSGVTWTTNSLPAQTNNWLCVGSSADGSKLVVGVNFGQVFLSTNAGNAWNLTTLPVTNWQSVACSADGTKMVAVGGGYTLTNPTPVPGPLYTSTNGGITWTWQTNAPVETWFSVASSADGNRLVAAASGKGVFKSMDAGVTWSQSLSSGLSWESVATSADGAASAAVPNAVPYGSGYIRTYKTTNSPSLGLAVVNGQLTLSWTIPSTTFDLQQSSDLSNWTNVAVPPVTNITNLQNQAWLPPSSSNAFYRLENP